MATVAQHSTRKLAPVSGVARWVDATTLTIKTDRLTETYAVSVGNGFARLAKSDGKVYEVALDEGRCSCPDHKYNRRECKHIKALRSALPKRPAR